MNLNNIDLYFITDSNLTKKSVVSDVRSALKSGVKIVQYREENKSTKEQLKEAAELKELCKGKAIYLVNNRVDIALAVNADGVHLGQDDMPYGSARLLLGHDKIIGITVHTVEEAILAESLGADYIAASPIFYTNTKPDAGKAKGIELIKEIKQKINIPIIAIGGINLDNLVSVIKAGADGAVAISAVITKDNVEAECKKFINLIKKFKK